MCAPTQFQNFSWKYEAEFPGGKAKQKKMFPYIIHIVHNGKYAFSLGICNTDKKILFPKISYRSIAWNKSTDYIITPSSGGYVF